MQITQLKRVDKRKVHDITVAGNHEYVLANGAVVSNTGIYYSASNIWIIGRQQDKVGTEIQGYHFVINVEKSRFVKEKSKIPISVSWDGGIDKYSGIFDLAVEGGFITKVGQFAQLLDIKTGLPDEGPKVRPKRIPDSYWAEFITYKPFAEFITNKYTIGLRQMISDDIDEIDTDDDTED